MAANPDADDLPQPDADVPVVPVIFAAPPGPVAAGLAQMLDDADDTATLGRNLADEMDFMQARMTTVEGRYDFVQNDVNHLFAQSATFEHVINETAQRTTRLVDSTTRSLEALYGLYQGLGGRVSTLEAGVADLNKKYKELDDKCKELIEQMKRL